MTCAICSFDEIPLCTFVVTLSHGDRGFLFSRHKQRDTWETQGGHIEPNETAEQAAIRELYEEAGAVPASITPVCGYWAEQDGDRHWGMVFWADIDHLDPLPQSEMAEVRWFDGLPDHLTYPQITPVLFDYAMHWLKEERL